jgi:cytochrome P450
MVPGEQLMEQYPADWPTDLSVDGLSLTDPHVLASPNPYYRALREKEPVHYDEQFGVWVVSRYADIQAILQDAVTFSQEMGWNRQFARGHIDEFKSILIRDGGGWYPEVLLLDPPKHTRIRKLLEKALAARRVKDMEPRIRALIAEQIESFADRGEADGVADFAVPLTINVICQQLGFPQGEETKDIAIWARAYAGMVHGTKTREEMLESAALICKLQNFIIDRVNERKEARQEDMISDLIYARLEEDDDAQLDFGETVALTRGLFNAGNDTTARSLSSILYIIATQPEIAAQLQQVIADDAKLGRFIEEILRIYPSVRGLFRNTTRAVEIAGTRIPEGANIMLLYASGNDDPDVFPCPRHFDPSRNNVARHLSFGGGIHHCAGISLARMELRLAVREVMTRLKDIELAVPQSEIRFAPFPTIMSIESLPLKFKRR